MVRGVLRCSVRFAVIFIVAGLAMAWTMNAKAAESPFAEKVKQALAAMKADAAKLGEPKLDGANLLFGATKMNDNFELVDSLKNRFGGTATFFVKKGDAFVRVSTNVMKDGQRAVGTPLDPSGPAIAAIRQDKPYYGMVDILGKLYDTGYEPIKNTAGEIIGIYYIGYLLE